MPKMNPQKSRQLRPLRIFLAGLSVILSLLVFSLFPIAKKTVRKTVNSPATLSETPRDASSFLYLSGFSELLEEELESRLISLGVPEEEFSHPEEYLDKDELFAFEAKAILASEMEANWVLAAPADLEKLRTIFSLDAKFSFAEFSVAESVPVEYKNLVDLLAEYDRTLTTVEDYDAPAEIGLVP